MKGQGKRNAEKLAGKAVKTGDKRLDRARRGRKLRELFLVFLKIGAFTFGGGYAMIPLIQREVAEKKKWISDGDIFEIIAQSMERHKKMEFPDLDEILAVENETYQWIESRW